MKDDPELDATDFAHPAWWRGHINGCEGTCMRIERILEGQDDGSGVLGNKKLESLRRKLLKIMETKR